MHMKFFFITDGLRKRQVIIWDATCALLRPPGMEMTPYAYNLHN